MVKIISDSTSDLSQDLLDRYNITLVPLIVRLGDQQYEDRVNITSEEIFRWSDSTKKAPTTACANVWTIQEVFQKYLETYDEIVAFSISGKMSATGANMVEAAAEMGASARIHVVDSQSLSTGIGLLVLEAAELAQNGQLTAQEIQQRMEQRRELLDVSFLVEQLGYLRKGGRCSSVAALGANMLSLRPCIQVKDGKMGVGKKYRGAYQKCLLQYVKDRLEGRDDIDLRRIFITESGGFTPEEVAEVETAVRSYQPFEEVLHTRAGCTVSSHCGPGTIGVLFLYER